MGAPASNTEAPTPPPPPEEKNTGVHMSSIDYLHIILAKKSLNYLSMVHLHVLKVKQAPTSK